jgi:hypothetical protein
MTAALFDVRLPGRSVSDFISDISQTIVGAPGLPTPSFVVRSSLTRRIGRALGRPETYLRTVCDAMTPLVRAAQGSWSV